MIRALETIEVKNGAVVRVVVDSKGTPSEGTRQEEGPVESWEWVCNGCGDVCTNLTLPEALAEAHDHVCPVGEAR